MMTLFQPPFATFLHVSLFIELFGKLVGPCYDKSEIHLKNIRAGMLCSMHVGFTVVHRLQFVLLMSQQPIHVSVQCVRESLSFSISVNSDETKLSH